MLSDSQQFGASGSDIRALFYKARLGNSRYLTFAQEKPAEAVAQVAESTPKTEESSKPFAPVSQPRRAWNAAIDVSARIKMASAAPRKASGSGVCLAFVSCCGGAGKTTLCATVARALSARLHNVLVADRCPDGIVPFYFSLERQGPGGLQTVYPNARRSGYPIMLVAAPCDKKMDADTGAWLQGLQADASMTLVDLPTLHGASPMISIDGSCHAIVPLVPDIQSVASVQRAEASAAALFSGKVSFLLNRYDDGLPLHREIRHHLEGLLGDRLAPVAIRESPLVSEALSLGMTVLDHAPQSPVAEDVEKLSAWLEGSLTEVNDASGKVEIA